MGQISSEPYIKLSLIIPQGDGQKVLMLPGEGGWVLPRVEMHPPPGDSWHREAAHINSAVREQLGLRATVLRCVYVGSDAEGTRTGTFLIRESRP